jgi:hypothetical protein
MYVLVDPDKAAQMALESRQQEVKAGAVDGASPRANADIAVSLPATLVNANFSLSLAHTHLLSHLRRRLLAEAKKWAPKLRGCALALKTKEA